MTPHLGNRRVGYVPRASEDASKTSSAVIKTWVVTAIFFGLLGKLNEPSVQWDLRD
jgi:hypothetical protein